MSPAERLREIIKQEFNNNISEFARYFNVSSQTVTPYLNGKRNLGRQWKSKLAELGINIDWLEKGEGNMKSDGITHLPNARLKHILEVDFANDIQSMADALGIPINSLNTYISTHRHIGSYLCEKLALCGYNIEWVQKGIGDIKVSPSIKTYECLEKIDIMSLPLRDLIKLEALLQDKIDKVKKITNNLENM